MELRHNFLIEWQTLVPDLVLEIQRNCTTKRLHKAKWTDLTGNNTVCMEDL